MQLKINQAHSGTKPITLKEFEEVVGLLNEMLSDNVNSSEPFTETENKLIQRFVDHYQKLQHHADTTVGLWATDRPDKFGIDGERKPASPGDLLFKIIF